MTAVPKLKHRMRGEIKRKRTPTTHRQVSRELDKVFSQYIRKRDGKCMVHANPRNGLPFGCSKVLQCNHLVSRNNMRLRWDEKNCVAACREVNLWAHYNQDDWYALWRRLFPERIEYLDISRRNHKKYSLIELQILLTHYTAKP